MQPRGKIERQDLSSIFYRRTNLLSSKRWMAGQIDQVLLLLIGRGRAPLLPPDYSFSRVNFLGGRKRNLLAEAAFAQDSFTAPFSLHLSCSRKIVNLYLNDWSQAIPTPSSHNYTAPCQTRRQFEQTNRKMANGFSIIINSKSHSKFIHLQAIAKKSTAFTSTAAHDMQLKAWPTIQILYRIKTES